MARIVVLTHATDDFDRRASLMRRIATTWRAEGHDVVVAAGTRGVPSADVAILHIDLSVIPQDYLDVASRFPRVLNGRVTDIRKRSFSRHLVQRDDSWAGPVIVKTDLNFGGLPEVYAVQKAQQTGATADPTLLRITATNAPYPLFASVAAVPASVWDNPGLVVERFLPERDAHGFVTRAWVFLGDKERCTRYVSTQPIVKSSGIIARSAAEVPEALRIERARLGFDYGKFDFALHDGQPILFDVNRTPAAPPAALSAEYAESDRRLARGLEAWLHP